MKCKNCKHDKEKHDKKYGCLVLLFTKKHGITDCKCKGYEQPIN